MPRGHLRQRSSGSWTINLYIGRDPVTGKKRYKSVTVRGTKAQAERHCSEMVHQLNTGSYVEPSRESVADFMRTWLADYAETHVRPRTLAGYRGNVDRYIIPALGRLPVANLGPRHIQSFESDLLRRGLSPTTVLHSHRVLSQALRWGVRMGTLPRNPAEMVDPPRPRREESKALEWDDVVRVLGAANGSPYYPVILLAVLTGLRRSELLALRWRDVNFQDKTAAVSRSVSRNAGGEMVYYPPKSGRARVVDLPADAVTNLRDLREAWNGAGQTLTGDDLIFRNLDGSPVVPDSVTQMFSRLARKLELNGARFHDLRHTHASLMLAAGIPLKVISERLGHSGIGITGDLYSHVLPGVQRDAVVKWEEKFGLPQNRDCQKNAKTPSEATKTP